MKNFFVVCFVLVVFFFAVLFAQWYQDYRIESWAQQRGYSVVSYETRWIRTGPFYAVKGDTVVRARLSRKGQVRNCFMKFNLWEFLVVFDEDSNNE